MTWVSIIGVAVGVAALVIVLSVMGGFEKDLKNKMLRGAPHLEVVSAASSLAGFSLLEHPLTAFESVFADAQVIAPYTQSDVVMKRGKHIYPAVLFGVDSGRVSPWGYSQAMVDGEIDSINSTHRPLITLDNEKAKWPGIVLGSKLAEHLSADLGDEISILSPGAALSTRTAISGGTVVRHFVVTGVFHTGLFNYDTKWAVVNLSEGRKFMQDYDPSLDADRFVTGVAINTLKPFDVDELKDRLTSFQGLVGQSWKDSNASLIFALKLEKFTMGSILMLIVLVAAFSISGTMMMTVHHKRQQVSLLRSIGMTQKDIVKLFVLQGFTISSVGIGLGLAFGILTCTLMSFFSRIREIDPMDLAASLPWDHDWLYAFFHWFYGVAEALRFFPVKFLPVEYVVICLFAWLLGILGASYPAWTAARQDPSSGLRY